MCGRPKF